MKKIALYIFVFCLTILLTSFSWLPVNTGQKTEAKINFTPEFNFGLKYNAPEKLASLLYDYMCLAEKGLSKEAFQYAYNGYRQLLDNKKIDRPDFLTICDFSQSSKQKRLYLIDLTKNAIVLNTYVAHGRNSGGEYATKFSNKPESLQSSLGFYVTKNTYKGEHGLSLKVQGLEPGFNDKAYQRAIVVHGAAYAEEQWTKRGNYLGRSFGCPAIPKKESKSIINTIKNGTCLFIYHPSAKYLLGSKILND